MRKIYKLSCDTRISESLKTKLNKWDWAPLTGIHLFQLCSETLLLNLQIFYLFHTCLVQNLENNDTQKVMPYFNGSALVIVFVVVYLTTLSRPFVFINSLL